ncbi:hypothetical protein XH94_23345 [Bradyrhizobium zhanjiangense]|uniref:Uncharacterized protein n=1 Tax=Bradyrhizobium zhanjiangense TaxID=1325107 RepID=A0A4Q0SFP2_9BRAD|nr:hypothetical protein XH94_23345 [Bradyrhizobium zhanjiangense]
MKRESSIVDITAADALALLADVRPVLAGKQDASQERGLMMELSGERARRTTKSGKVQSAG